MSKSDFNPQTFHATNVVDSCAVWNLVSSAALYQAARSAGLETCITRFVYYELFNKPRNKVSEEEQELMDRARQAILRNEITVHSLAIEDLQDMDALSARKALGRGELSSIVFAKKVNIAMISDDKKATILARCVLGNVSRASTTPRVLGWLLFYSYLTQRDAEEIAQQHQQMRRPLGDPFREMIEIINIYKNNATR